MKSIKREKYAKRLEKFQEIDKKFKKEYEDLTPDEQERFFGQLWDLKHDVLDRYNIAKETDKLSWRKLAKVWLMLFKTFEMIKEYEYYFQFPRSKAPWMAMDSKMEKILKLSPSNANLADLIKTYQDKYDVIFEERWLQLEIKKANQEAESSDLNKKVRAQNQRIKELNKKKKKYQKLIDEVRRANSSIDDLSKMAK